MNQPPSLPPGWSEHTGPNAQLYYFNVHTQQSTYVRPLPSFPVAQTPAQKDRPILKTAIPGTEWLRVKTSLGNAFYMHKGKKQSVWTIPDEIKDAVAAIEREESGVKNTEVGQQDEDELMKELGRIKEAVSQELVKRKAAAVADDAPPQSKKARVDLGSDEEDEDEDSDEEEWQRQAAAQLAKEAEEEEERRRQVEEQMKLEEQKQKEIELNMPEKVNLSIEEGKALFKTLLREKDINPLHPWDTCLPLFISDPRYVLLPSVTARREAFDEYCRDRVRELRQNQVKNQKAEADPKAEFDRLLVEEVKSTRTNWNDFRKAWKKNRQFYGWGRDDHEREKRFKSFIRELGEKKRAAAQKAESDFFALLKESDVNKADGEWKDIKRKIQSDPRYDAVGSSSLREELFNTFLKANTSRTHPVDYESSAPHDTIEQSKSREERKAQALKEREEKIRADRSRVEAAIGRSRMGLSKEEGERDFRTMLTDAIRDPQMTWEKALPQLKTDPRLTSSPLPINQQLHLFHEHVSKLHSKHLEGLHALFEACAPTLDVKFDSLLVESLTTSLPAVKLGYVDDDALRLVFEKWQRERTTDARKAFDEMLKENSFVEFWGRLGKIGGEGVDGGIKADEEGEEEGEGGGGKVDMKALAKNVDVAEVEKVLKHDKRYIMFDHIPKQREDWVRDYLSQLTASELSVHTRH